MPDETNDSTPNDPVIRVSGPTPNDPNIKVSIVETDGQDDALISLCAGLIGAIERAIKNYLDFVASGLIRDIRDIDGVPPFPEQEHEEFRAALLKALEEMEKMLIANDIEEAKEEQEEADDLP